MAALGAGIFRSWLSVEEEDEEGEEERGDEDEARDPHEADDVGLNVLADAVACRLGNLSGLEHDVGQADPDEQPQPHGDGGEQAAELCRREGDRWVDPLAEGHEVPVVVERSPELFGVDAEEHGQSCDRHRRDGAVCLTAPVPKN